MGLRKGQTPVAKGKKGVSGRKSAFQELKDARRLWQLWTDIDLPKQLQEKLKKGEGLSAEEMHLLRGFMKSDANLNAIFQKLYPDNLKVGGNGIIQIQISGEIAKKNKLDDTYTSTGEDSK